MKVVSKQKNSRHCYVCGLYNPVGLKAEFYNMEDGSVMTLFKYNFMQQSYPQRVHGGLICTMLDELAFRAYWAKEEDVFGVTTSMETKYRKPVPYDVDIIGKAIIVSDTFKFFKAHAQILDVDGKVYAESITNYIKLPVEKIAQDVNYHNEMIYSEENYLEEI